MKKKLLLLLPIVAIVCCYFVVSSCQISYKFNGASIDYSKVKTICINDFPNRAALVYPELAPKFNDELRDIYSRQTRLQSVTRNGDLNIEGAITGYTLQPLAIGTDALAAQTRLTLSIHVEFTNNSDPNTNFEKTFSANRTFDSSNTLEDVQEALCEELVKEIVEQIFNETVSNW
ncbi:MAG: LPS assembly lipoprotein LptE [Paludibacteraceae bacterium]|nr:LPS assembly lipoprotein LptE [Paludibacteraceae bacterium]